MNPTRSLLAGGLLASAALLLATPASAAMIGFEDFGNVGTSGPVVTTQYLAQGVTFSSADGQANQVSSQAGIGDGLNFLCTGSGTINCAGETILTFTSGVSGLSFLAVGSDAAGNNARVDVYVGNQFAGTRDILVSGHFNAPDLVDLSAYSDVTSIRLYAISDPGGLGWDDFRFNTTAVPEPGSVAMMLAGLGALAFARRQRRG